MEIVNVSESNIDNESLNKAVKILKNDGLIVYPTDTLYALGANALSQNAIKKVFDVKGRDWNKPISVAVSSVKDAKKYFTFNELAENIAKKFLPGPLTIILPSSVLPKELSPTGKFSFRIPDNKIALCILEKVDFPVTATSANLSDSHDPTDAKTAIEQIGSKVDMVVDSEKCKYGRPSTVVDLTENKITVVREGVITKEELNMFNWLI